jgi:hypothetical protein
MWRGILGLVLLLTSCGRPGDPLPPFIRIPESVNDLAASQREYDLILTWTNPARNIDGSSSTDLERVHIFSNGTPLVTVEVTSGGERQFHILPGRSLLGMTRTFAVKVQTTDEKVSEISNSVSITPVDVPGRVGGLRYLVDQNRITLEWDPPAQNPDLADVYLVNELNGNGVSQAPVLLSERRFEDETYEVDDTHTYTVTPVRKTGPVDVPGFSETIEVIGTDRTAPRAPTGLEIVASDDGAFLTWMANPESDLAGYRVFRSGRPDAGFEALTRDMHPITGLFDAGYRPGLYYAVSAVDESGNESSRSTPHRAP